MVLDIMMPGTDGLTVLRKMRRRNDATPVILLTAKDSIEDRVAGLDAGANDYLVKPFAFEELLARIRVLLRKPAEAPKTCYRVGDLEVHMDTQEVSRGGKMIRLSGKEFALLDLLCSSPGKLIPREEIYAKIWGTEVVVGDRTIDVHIRKLRQKIGDERIVTVKGVGYKYEP